VRQLAAFLGRSPDTATVEDLRRYQLHLVWRPGRPICCRSSTTMWCSRCRRRLPPSPTTTRR
jgi:hypothetical protein